MILPLIRRIEKSMEKHNKLCPGVVDLVLFNGASNAIKAGKIVAINHPCINVVHGAEHVVSLFFKDLYTHVSASRLLPCNFIV